MGIRAVVFDIGNVLEADTESPLIGVWAGRIGLSAEEVDIRLGDLWAGGVIGTVTGAAIVTGTSDRLGISAALADELMAEMWLATSATPTLS